jgi:hypothetical protein
MSTPGLLHTIGRSLSNREFLATLARPGLVGLACGDTLIDRVIARAEREVSPEKAWGRWTHAFVIGERRCDGQLWVIESDLDLHRRHIRLGAQENRIDKYDDGTVYTSLALLDFGLTPETVTRLLAGGLEMVAGRTRYSLRELVGTFIALRHPQLLSRRNPLERPESFYCSAFVRCLFLRVGLDLTPGLDIKHTAPENLWHSPLAPEAWLLAGAVPESRIARTVDGVRRQVRLNRIRRQRRQTGQSGRQ